MPERPNIVFFFTDQQRWDTCGCYGQPLDVTPELDTMASQGVRFDLAFTCQPVCGPARACLQTGRYAAEIGVFTNGIRLPRNEKTLAHHLGDAGYQTAYVGKWHLASSRHHEFEQEPVPPHLRGGYRDFWHAADVLEFTSHGYGGHMWDADGNRVDFPEGRYRADHVTDVAMDFIRRRDTERPFFLFISYIEPHHQNDRDRYEGPRGSRERFADFVPPEDLTASDAEGDWRQNYPDYLGCCRSLDDNLSRIRRLLEQEGIADETLVLFTSDHGSHFRTRNTEYKRACHDACIRIPMVACGPGFTGGAVIDDLVSLIDIPPTILAAAGLEPPPSHRGRALQGLVDGTAEDWPDEVFLQISEDHVGRAIRTKKWKYEVWVPGVGGGSQPGAAEYTEARLYDLEADPHEQVNRVCEASLADVRAHLAERLIARMAAAGEAPPLIRPTVEPAPADGRFEKAR